MIFGIGIDIIEVSRMEKQLSKKDTGFQQSLFTETEIKYCESKINKAQRYAGKFAAKEAFFKAIGSGWRNGLAWKDIEIINNDSGKPNIVLHGKAKEFAENNNIQSIHISITHIKENAIATIILEKQEAVCQTFHTKNE